MPRSSSPSILNDWDNSFRRYGFAFDRGRDSEKREVEVIEIEDDEVEGMSLAPTIDEEERMDKFNWNSPFRDQSGSRLNDGKFECIEVEQRTKNASLSTTHEGTASPDIQCPNSSTSTVNDASQFVVNEEDDELEVIYMGEIKGRLVSDVNTGAADKINVLQTKSPIRQQLSSSRHQINRNDVPLVDFINDPDPTNQNSLARKRSHSDFNQLSSEETSKRLKNSTAEISNAGVKTNNGDDLHIQITLTGMVPGHQSQRPKVSAEGSQHPSCSVTAKTGTTDAVQPKVSEREYRKNLPHSGEVQQTEACSRNRHSQTNVENSPKRDNEMSNRRNEKHSNKCGDNREGPNKSGYISSNRYHERRSSEGSRRDDSNDRYRNRNTGTYRHRESERGSFDNGERRTTSYKKQVRFNDDDNTRRDYNHSRYPYARPHQDQNIHYRRSTRTMSDDSCIQSSNKQQEDLQHESQLSHRSSSVISRSTSTSEDHAEPAVPAFTHNDGGIGSSNEKRNSNHEIVALSSPRSNKLVNTATNTEIDDSRLPTSSVASRPTQEMSNTQISNVKNKKYSSKKSPIDILKLARFCSVCPMGKNFDNRRDLVTHLKIAHDKKLCPVCYEPFAIRGTTLKEHFIKVHTNQNIAEKAECPTCEEKFDYDGMYHHVSKKHLIPLERSMHEENNRNVQSNSASETRTRGSQPMRSQTQTKPNYFQGKWQEKPFQGTSRTSYYKNEHRNRFNNPPRRYNNYKKSNSKVHKNDSLNKAKLAPNSSLENSSTQNDPEHNLTHASRCGIKNFKIPKK